MNLNGPNGETLNYADSRNYMNDHLADLGSDLGERYHECPPDQYHNDYYDDQKQLLYDYHITVEDIRSTDIYSSKGSGID